MPKNNICIETRMKENYENRSKTYLTRRTPVIIRLDGKAFHTLTKHFSKPYDIVFHNTMEYTMKYLCENIQGCKIGYTQSDEITLLLTDYDTLTTDAWFDYSVQKLCSISASMATMAFNKALLKNVRLYEDEYNNSFTPQSVEMQQKHKQYVENLFKAIDKGAMFDSRCFNIPESEVTNCFIWRQQDAIRNSTQMLGQHHFSERQLKYKSCSEIRKMLLDEIGINFNQLPVRMQRGVCCRKYIVPTEDGNHLRSKWQLDYDIPIFSENREYIELLLPVVE